MSSAVLSLQTLSLETSGVHALMKYCVLRVTVYRIY